jgi:hypothetical protein
VLAAEATVDSPDFGHLEPMVTASERELTAIRIDTLPEIVLADAGYWHQAQMDAIIGRGMQVLITPDAGKRKGEGPGWNGGLYAFMRPVLDTDHGGDLYAKQRHDRAGVRRRELQPALRPPTTPRQIRGEVGMAPDHRHAQLAEVLAPQHSPDASLKRRTALAASVPPEAPPLPRRSP